MKKKSKCKCFPQLQRVGEEGTEQLPGLGLMKAPLQRGFEPDWPAPEGEGEGRGGENQKTHPVSCSFMQLKSDARRATS